MGVVVAHSQGVIYYHAAYSSSANLRGYKQASRLFHSPIRRRI